MIAWQRYTRTHTCYGSYSLTQSYSNTLYITIYSHHLLWFAVKYNGHLDLKQGSECKTYSSLLAWLPPVQRDLLLYSYMLLLCLPCSCSGHATQIQSSQLQPRVLEESLTTLENAKHEHAQRMCCARWYRTLAHINPAISYEEVSVHAFVCSELLLCVRNWCSD